MEPKTIIGLIVVGLIVSGLVLLVLWKKGIIFKKVKDEETETDTVKIFLNKFYNPNQQSITNPTELFNSFYSKYKFVYDAAKNKNINICFVENNINNVMKILNSLNCLFFSEIDDLGVISVIILRTMQVHVNTDYDKIIYKKDQDSIRIDGEKFINDVFGTKDKFLVISYSLFKSKILSYLNNIKFESSKDSNIITITKNCFNEHKCEDIVITRPKRPPPPPINTPHHPPPINTPLPSDSSLTGYITIV